MNARLLTAEEGRAMLGFKTLSGFYRYVRRNQIASAKHDGDMRFEPDALLRPRPAKVIDFYREGVEERRRA